MTERKPAGKSWETWTEELIHYAREAGEFEALEGAGKPIPGMKGRPRASPPSSWTRS